MSTWALHLPSAAFFLQSAAGSSSSLRRAMPTPEAAALLEAAASGRAEPGAGRRTCMKPQRRKMV